MKNLFLIMLLVSVCACSNQTALVDLVNPLQGTMSEFKFSTGNTYPAISLPWGMNFWTPQTRGNGNGWQYVYSDTLIQGFKQTHQPSPWINDYGCFSVMPLAGQLHCGQKERAASFTHETEVAHPYYYGVQLSSGIKAELTPTERGSIMRFTYPSSKAAYLVIDCFNMEGNIAVSPTEKKIVGSSNFYAPNNSAKLPENFATHFIMYLNVPIEDWGTVTVNGMLCAWLKLDTQKNSVVELKTASSFIGKEQAEVNYSYELNNKNFDEVCKAARESWNAQLSKVTVTGGTEEQQRIFYSALYRTMLFPHKLHEIDITGRIVHYDFFNGGVKEGVMIGGNGFWDTFRSVHPLFTIMHPSKSSEVMNALCNIYKEGGWLPEWFAPGYKDCMIGQHSVAIVTDAMVKGIQDYDTNLMYEAFIKGANNEGPKATGRKGYDDYNRLGYVPYDNGVKESVSRTLEYAYNDYCISIYAEKLGHSADAELYRKRAYNYRNIFDPSINFVRPRSLTGKWQCEWRPDTWGGSFTEGSSWHWTWCVYHDPRGLIELMGGEEAFISKMDSVFTVPPTVEDSYYGGPIHEMTEMIAGDRGQYAHGNQPIQHMIYLYNYAGTPSKAQWHVRDIMNHFYSSGITDGRGYCGDEDNGQTSAWYVFSAMGFYPVCPGNAEYVIGSPLFDEVKLQLENGKIFTVKAVNNTSENVYIQSATLNDQPFDNCFITHEQIMSGSTLVLNMGNIPNIKWGTARTNRPHSLSDKN